MFKVNNETRVSKSNLLTKGLLIITANMLFLTTAFASENNDSPSPTYSISQGAYKSEFSDKKRKEIIANNKLTIIPDQLNNRATSVIREEMINSQSSLIKKSAKNLIVQKNHYDYYADFAIYDATSFLEDDFDGDGFYQTFSVVFDADIYSYTEKQWGEVYALLYLSKNGGPWTHYYTTDNFIIEGESDADQYEVITTFLSGYSADHYDVLIDLYQVGTSDIVASYSSDDNNALYALSLESADFDEPYIEVVEVYGGGSLSFVGLLIIFISGVYRFYIRIK